MILDYIASTGPAIPELDSARGGFADLPTLIGSNASEIGASRPFGVTRAQPHHRPPQRPRES